MRDLSKFINYLDLEEGDLIVKEEGRALIIKFNRPHKRNAILGTHYMVLIRTLSRATKDNNIALVVITGAGDYFTAGNDFSIKAFQEYSSHFANTSDEKVYGSPFKRFITALINFPKPLIAVVNGPAVGVGVTMLGLCDVVYANEKATFHTPFVSLGVVPEGCSSYLFPQLMGYGKAAKMLMFGEKMTAQEAYKCGFVTHVYKDQTLNYVWDQILQWANYPPKVLTHIKTLMASHTKEFLHKVNDIENEVLMERFQDPDTIQNLMKRFSKKSKL